MKYVIFGDSFADKKFPEGDHVRWFNLLDKKSHVYGHMGSGIWHSIDSLFNYINSEMYDPTHRIIFISTFWKRAIRYTDNKFIKDQYRMRYPTVAEPSEEWEKYHAENEIAHKYICDNVLTVEMFSNTIKMLRAYLNQLPNDTLLLPAYDTFETTEHFKLHDVSLLDFSSDFVVMNKILSELSELRPNHISYENHHILADMIIKYFETEDFSVFNINKFKKNNLTRKTMLELYGIKK